MSRDLTFKSSVSFNQIVYNRNLLSLALHISCQLMTLWRKNWEIPPRKSQKGEKVGKSFSFRKKHHNDQSVHDLEWPESYIVSLLSLITFIVLLQNVL